MSEKDKEKEELLYWIKIIGKMNIRTLILSCLTKPQEHVLYQNSDGKQGFTELTRKAKMTQTKIQDYWSKWEKLDIIEKIPVRGGERGKRIFDLEELGIEIPHLD